MVMSSSNCGRSYMIPLCVRETIEKIHGLDYCIAGGWAACPALADDMDVWLYGIQDDNDEDGGGEHERIRGLLADNFVRDYGSAFEEQNTKTTYLAGGLVTRVGYISDGGVKLHVLITDQSRPIDLVEAFDISTHAVAITSEGMAIKSKRWTPVNVPPKKLADTSTTDARMEKICARFGFCYDSVAQEATRG
jgi:hypothetical protein